MVNPSLSDGEATRTATTEESLLPSAMSSHDQAQVGANQSVPARVSYASMVCNSDRENMRAPDGLDLDPDRVVVLDKDYVVNHNGKLRISLWGKSPLVSVEPDTSSVAADNSDVLFGPWMVVDTRCRRQQSSSTVNKSTAVSGLRSIGSRFAILEPDSIARDLTPQPAVDVLVQQSPLVLRDREVDEQRTTTDVGAVSPSVIPNAAYRASNLDKKLKVAQVVVGASTRQQ
ncbi:hypothetical protein V6N13_142881 [Hibiscus sabdariffa]|uniref:Uncharacterized protein n=1 Tax=Hibiscus sabdariffa TaxID=183260 RepID=A0ABR2FFP0_9ROSI